MSPQILIGKVGAKGYESSDSDDEENDIEIARRVLLEYAKYDKKYLDNISDMSPLKFSSFN